MQYDSLVLYYLNQFKLKLNSSEENSPNELKIILSEINNIESLITIHSHKIKSFSLFLSEIQNLRLKISALKKLYPTPKKKMSFFSLTLAKMKENHIKTVASKEIIFDILNPKRNEKKNLEEEILINDGPISKKKMKDEVLSKQVPSNEIMGVFVNTVSNKENNNAKPQPFINKNQNIQQQINNRMNSFANDNQQDNRMNPIYTQTTLEKYPINNASYQDPYSKNNYPKQNNYQRNQQKPIKEISEPNSGFVTAKDQLRLNNPSFKYQQPTNEGPDTEEKQANSTLNKKFQPPYKNPSSKNQTKNLNSTMSKSKIPEEKMKGLDQKMIETIENEILDNSPKISWADIAGLENQKTKIVEMIVWPFSNPDIFKGIRAPPRGLLLFGPPGTGKTMIGKAIASDTNFTFFSISASSLTSKWVGEGEKMVKTLFMLASAYQPAVIFIDEVDSLLCSRTENENESSRRIKTEFLCQMEGTNTNPNERLLFIGATNRPQELDDAALRRFVKKLYIPLPNGVGRKQFLERLIEKEIELGNSYELNESEIEEIVQETKGYSGADLRNLCAEAALNPIREAMDIKRLVKENLRPTKVIDFRAALRQVKPTVSNKDLRQYLDWNKNYGTVQFDEIELEN